MSRHSLKDHAWKRTREVVLARDGHQCVSCGTRTDLTVDHIKPVSKMSDDELAQGLHRDPDRLLTLCRPCNSSKGDREVLRRTWINPVWAAAFSEVRPGIGSTVVEPFSHGPDPKIPGVVLRRLMGSIDPYTGEVLEDGEGDQ